ncbi:MAG TPA: ATPase, T2SS/T4P/T4SS family [Polyangiaceae bacterium]|nr:ATPase, T2SS/T4P/T4SS family [Polyangiaceae bacterium]
MGRNDALREALWHLFGPVRPYLDDEGVGSVLINGPDEVFVERGGRLERVPARFADRASLEAALQSAAQFAGARLDGRHPVLEAALPDGSRLEAVLPPAAPEGPYAAIRRRRSGELSLERLVEAGALSDDAAQALRALLAARCQVLVSGAASSGKSSLLGALIAAAPEGERVVVVEEGRELAAARPHTLRLETGAGDARELLRAALRLRPDRLVVGELRGAEALDFAQAMAGGFGTLAALRASHPRDALARFEGLCLMADAHLPPLAVRNLLAGGLHAVVHTARLHDGSCRVTHVSEVRGFDVREGTYLTVDLFYRPYRGVVADGAAQSELIPTGTLPRFLPRLREHGVDLPLAVYEMAERRGTSSPPERA